MDDKKQPDAFDNEGPITTYVRLGWNSAWQAIAEGNAADGHILSIENFLSRQRGQSPSHDSCASEDLEFAESINRFNAAQYWHHLKYLEHRASQFQQYCTEASAHNQAINLHLFKSLALAHGAAIVATLAYLSDIEEPGHFPWILLVCGLGFLMSLLGARLALHAGNKILQIIAPLTFPLTPENEVAERHKKISEFGNSSLRYEWPTWLSVALLVGALFLGTSFLLEDFSKAIVMRVFGN